MVGWGAVVRTFLRKLPKVDLCCVVKSRLCWHSVLSFSFVHLSFTSMLKLWLLLCLGVSIAFDQRQHLHKSQQNESKFLVKKKKRKKEKVNYMKEICKEGNHFSTFPESQKNSEDFPGNIVFKTLGFQCKVSDRWLGNYDAICHVVQSENQIIIIIIIIIILDILSSKRK